MCLIIVPNDISKFQFHNRIVTYSLKFSLMYIEILTRKATISLCCMTSYTCNFHTCRYATIKESQILCKRVKQVCSDALHLFCQMNTL
jgi:hypothetical protein